MGNQSVLTEAPFLCARAGRRGLLTNCADTVRLVVDLVAVRLTFLDVWFGHPSQTCLCHMKCVCGTCLSTKIP